MNHSFKIVALIPARSGSKGIPDKNIKIYKEYPLMAHSIKIALESEYINEVYVSTDSIDYQNIAILYGAKVTPLRPPNISDDLSPDIETFQHFIQMFKDRDEKIPDIIIHLRPTYPNRKIDILNNCIELFINNYNNYDSLRSIVEIKKSPYKMYFIKNNHLIPFIENYNNLIEPYNQARQNFPLPYLHNGCIDIIKTDTIIKYNLLSGYNIYPFIMDENETDDIDILSDFITSENKN